ncbi:MAG: FxLYD domain-containing protein [Acidobacteriota bacterium]|nr:FxLYD domain-containing protein [Acidobacteriota bacterium]
MRQPRTTLLLVGALAWAATPAARADWVVTKEGGRFEIQGPWEVKGKLMIFKLPDGTLSSVRAEQVDFAASKLTTEEARRQAEGPAGETSQVPAKPKKKSVVALTDKDFRKGSVEPAIDPKDAKGTKDKEKDKAAKKEAAPDHPNSVQVTAWERVPSDKSNANGIQLTGMVRNSSADLATEIVVTANFYDDNGTLIGKFPADLSVATLPAGESAKFTVTAAGLFTFASAKFQVQNRSLRGKTDTPAGAAPAPPAPRTPRTPETAP